MARHRLEFRPLTEHDATAVATWFDGDEEGQRELGGTYGAHGRWWNLVEHDPDRHGWIIWKAGAPVGFADLEVNSSGVAAVAVYVKKEWRGHGLGTGIMRALGPVARETGAVRVKGGIRPDNAQSLKAALASGARRVGVDKDGYIEMLGPPLRGTG